MKTACLLLATFISVAAAAPSDAVEATPTPGSNSTSGHASVQYWYKRVCGQPANAPGSWYRLNKGDGPYSCHVYPLQSEWSMLNSYRDGGVQNVHWKYTDDPNDPECLNNWNYHAGDGRTLKTYVAGRTTTYGQNRRWCGLPVYNDGGVQGFQWQYCDCREVRQGGPPLAA